MRFFHFGPQDRRLFGTLHEASRSRPRTAGVLLCNPFGEEAARAHRTYRVLANQLERGGYAALRFDYSGTGDSIGDSEDVTLPDWVADVATAAAELQSVAGVRRVVAAGVGLGGTVTALATARTGLRLRHLVLWDPVINGRAYLTALATKHAEYMREELDAWRGGPRLSPDGLPVEAFGTPISAALAREIAAIDLASEPVRADYVTVVTTAPPSIELTRVVERLPPAPATRVVVMNRSEPWNSDASLNASIVPMDVIQAILSRIEEISP